MKPSCVDYLRCVSCTGQKLELTVDSADAGEVMEGTLACSCGASYPIIGGVPRILRKELLDDVLLTYGRANGGQSPQAASDAVADVQKATMSAFGFEWLRYSDYDADNYDNWMPEGFSPQEGFADRIGLEIGCGAGRHAEKTAQWAREHFAVDLSYAVDAAFRRNRHSLNCHVIQADAFALPFEGEKFDYVYCLGVIQHMHSPPDGFRNLAGYVREGGILLVNVYQSSRALSRRFLEALRKVTTRMPARPLNAICFVAGTFDFALCLGWRAIDRLGMASLFGWLVPERTKEYARHSYKTVVVDWYDRLACPVKLHYSSEELAGWYRNAGFEAVRVTPYWKAFWNGYGERVAAKGAGEESRVVAGLDSNGA
jgi:SAM-dependent methyltransferase/uncharacterized protein YbaR (Trm112 family)